MNKIEFDWTINVSTLIAAIVILCTVVVGYTDAKRDIDLLQERQLYIQDTYVSHEQLQYIVVEPIGRLDSKLDRRLLEIETKIEAQLNRIEDKLE